MNLIRKNVKNSDSSSILYSKPLQGLTKPKFEIGDSVRVSKYDLLSRKGYNPQFTQNKNIANLKEHKFTLQWVRVGVHWLNIQYDPWEL